MIVHQKDITEGKVKRTVLEQAIQEANHKWKNKKEKELYCEIENLDSQKKIIVRPMLANTFSFDLYKSKRKAFKIPFPLYVQRKYDGIRCIAYIKNNRVILESRKGLEFQNFELLKDQLYTLFKKLPVNFYFDGELFTTKLNFQTISGLVRTREKDVKKNEIDIINQIEYYIYDFIDLDDLSKIYKDRYHFLSTFLSSNVNIYSAYKNVETFLIDKLEDVKMYHDKFVSEGFEGIIIRDMNGIYEINKRSKYLQKFKDFLEEEFKIVGFKQGTGDEKGCIIWECITKENQNFFVRPVGSFESRKKLFKEGSQYVGKLLTVIFQEYSEDIKIPRFGVGKNIREDY
jgi:DNA ligase-1